MARALGQPMRLLHLEHGCFRARFRLKQPASEIEVLSGMHHPHQESHICLRSQHILRGSLLPEAGLFCQHRERSKRAADVRWRGSRSGIRCTATVESLESSFKTSKDASSEPISTGKSRGAGKTYFPYGDRFQIGEQVLLPKQVIEMLGPFMDDKRRERMAQVVAGRTYGIVPVVEGLIDLGNVAAVCRSAEALGCQNVHVIERAGKKYKASQRITAGAEKWLDFETWGSTQDCYAALRERGYRIAVTYCDGGTVSTPIEDMDWSIPTAVVLGNEHAGVSRDAIEGADLQCSIPMDGFVDSFNISVAAAIIMHHAKRKRGPSGDLTPEQQEILLAEFYLRNNSTTEKLLQHLLSREAVEVQEVNRSKL